MESHIDKDAIRRRALELIAEGGRGVGAKLAREMGIARQVANGYLQRLVSEDLAEAEGSTRARRYRLRALARMEKEYRNDGLEEDVLYREAFEPHVRDLPQKVRAIWQYGLNEMMNNAIEHSEAKTIRLDLLRNALFTECEVADDGEGIFRKIQRELGLATPHEAILELAKGKLTTDPERHTGEGIFFTSRVMDAFEIASGRLRFQHVAGSFDVLEERDAERSGTTVRMRLANDSPTALAEVFGRFADPEDMSFDRTVVPLRLAQYEGQQLVSRSQARRIAHRFERFKEVQLDFAGVESIGQAFADELFRVFARAHPEIRLVPIHTSPAVEAMIRRALAARSQ